MSVTVSITVNFLDIESTYPTQISNAFPRTSTPSVLDNIVNSPKNTKFLLTPFTSRDLGLELRGKAALLAARRADAKRGAAADPRFKQRISVFTHPSPFLFSFCSLRKVILSLILPESLTQCRYPLTRSSRLLPTLSGADPRNCPQIPKESA